SRFGMMDRVTSDLARHQDRSTLHLTRKFLHGELIKAVGDRRLKEYQYSEHQEYNCSHEYLKKSSIHFRNYASG
ncbi:MAG TPA: hypothetical protein VE954_03495, partial [Oligoflexus sp.]|uniref:hypothetical protein n=1 Tax=Oligoflexus sp. TaxID=1971216 RepID=UPI002D671BFB